MMVPIYDRTGAIARTYNFNELALPVSIAKTLAEAFGKTHAGRLPTTAAARWLCLRQYARYVKETGELAELSKIDTNALWIFIDWIKAQRRRDGKKWASGMQSSVYRSIEYLFKWIQQFRPQYNFDPIWPTNPFPRRNLDAKQVPRLSKSDLTKVLRACEKEIEIYWSKFLQGRRWLEDANPWKDETPRSIRDLVMRISRVHDGIIPSQPELLKKNHHRTRYAIHSLKGGKETAYHLYATNEAAYAYYLAILIHTAGNPDAVAKVSMDCLEEVPLLNDQAIFSWEKPRAGTIQRIAFSTKKRFHPPVLIAQMRQLTEPLRHLAPLKIKDDLFIYRATGKIASLRDRSRTYWHRHFLAKHQFPNFSMASVRASVLSIHYESMKDVKQTQAFANHESVRTTMRYVTSHGVSQAHAIQIDRAQEGLITWIKGGRTRQSLKKKVRGTSKELGAIVSGEYATLFGFDCRDPFAGVGPNSRKGRLCESFLGCFTCVNSILFVDAHTCSRLLHAKNHLVAAKSSMHPARWAAAYQPLLAILEQDLLPRFSAKIKEEAMLLSDKHEPLPELR